jgi:filamentous hemagglutinin family protein
MRSAIYLLPFLVLMTISGGTKIGQAQTYQPSNRVPLADSTLGTQVVGNGNDFAISGGVSRGNNTFHSFQDFSVPTNGSANFVNPVGNQSIITRVTGNLFSDINGTINTQGANFLLINPNGVVFGPGTQLNVGRVFAASTANGVDLADGAGRILSFGVNGAGDGALLSIDPKVIFNASRLNLGGGNGEINNFGTLRINNPGQYIGLVGGNVLLNGGQIISQAGGRVELGGLSATGSVDVGIEGANLRLSFPQDVARANVSLNNNAAINTVGSAGADISINAKNIEVLSGSNIFNGIRLGTGAAGDVKLRATESINIGGVNTIITNGVVVSGNGGNILLDAADVTVQDSASIATSTLGQGNLGDVVVTAKNNISLKDNANIASLANRSTEGNGGNISITASSVSLQDKSRIVAFMQGNGSNGNIKISSNNSLLLDNSSIANFVGTTGVGNGGDIDIVSGDLSVVKGTISTFTAGKGNAGNIFVKVENNAGIAANSFIASTVDAGSVGEGGNINIASSNLSIDNSVFFATTDGQGDAGNINIIAKDKVLLTGKSLLSGSVESGGIGKGGDINISSGFLSFSNSSSLLSSTKGQGGTGNINLLVKKDIGFSGKSSLLSLINDGGNGKAGDINVKSNSLSIQDAGIVSVNRVQGSAGNINLDINGKISLTEKALVSTFIDINGNGKSGDINIGAGSLTGDNSTISASTFGQGDAGNVRLIVRDALALNDSSVFSDVSAGGVGKGGNIDVMSGSLSLINGSRLLSVTRQPSDTQPAGRGDTGNINVKVVENAEFIGSKNRQASGLFASTDPGTEGSGGNINLEAKTLFFLQGAGLASSIAGQGNAGNITVAAKDNITFDDTAGILSRVEASGVGKGGDITVSGNSISFRRGAGLSSETLGQGNAGNIKVDAVKSIFISGEANIDRNIVVVDRGGIFTRSQSLNSAAGDITITAPLINLDNQGNINAQSNFGGGGNITIGNKNATDLFLLRRGAQVATDAGVTAQQGGDGGNININANFIFAIPKENSDISANAAQGRGGSVNINSQGLFGIQQRFQPSSNSDITASSSFGQNGIVNINTPGIDPGKDTSDLPSTPTDASRQITQTCNSSQVGNRFYITGRGGHPATSEESFTQEVVWLDSRNPRTSSAIAKTSTTPTQSPQPAVGWAFNGQGKVTLLAANSEIKRANVICSNLLD